VCAAARRFVPCADHPPSTPSQSKYSPPAPDNEGHFLCHLCSKALGFADYKGPQAAPKKKVERRQVRPSRPQEVQTSWSPRCSPRAFAPQIVHYEAKNRVPALTDVCISIVARHVEDVESLGDIGQENMRRVNNIICKNRKMCVPASLWSCDGSC
jgi:DNA repair protein RAD7